MEYNRGIVLKCFRRGDTEIMKKLISVLLASAMMLSMASCTSKKPSGHRDIEVVDGTKRELGGTEETYPVIVEPTETEAPPKRRRKRQRRPPKPQRKQPLRQRLPRPASEQRKTMYRTSAIHINILRSTVNIMCRRSFSIRLMPRK